MVAVLSESTRRELADPDMGLVQAFGKSIGGLGLPLVAGMVTDRFGLPSVLSILGAAVLLSALVARHFGNRSQTSANTGRGRLEDALAADNKRASNDADQPRNCVQKTTSRTIRTESAVHIRNEVAEPHAAPLRPRAHIEQRSTISGDAVAWPMHFARTTVRERHASLGEYRAT